MYSIGTVLRYRPRNLKNASTVVVLKDMSILELRRGVQTQGFAKKTWKTIDEWLLTLPRKAKIQISARKYREEPTPPPEVLQESQDQSQSQENPSSNFPDILEPIPCVREIIDAVCSIQETKEGPIEIVEAVAAVEIIPAMPVVEEAMLFTPYKNVKNVEQTDLTCFTCFSFLFKKSKVLPARQKP